MVSLFNIVLLLLLVLLLRVCVCVCVCIFAAHAGHDALTPSTAAMVGRSISRSAQDKTNNVLSPLVLFTLSLSLSFSFFLSLFERGGVCHTLFCSVGKRSEKIERERESKKRKSKLSEREIE